LLTNGYENAGAELAMLVLDILNELGKEIDSDLRQLIKDLEVCYPTNTSHRVEFLKAAVKWTVKYGHREYGDPQLHCILAKSLWTNGDRSSSIYHFAAGEAPELFCQKLEDYGTEAQQSAREQYLTLGVLHFLALENLRDANELMACYRRWQKNRNTTTAESDLTTFLKYLLLTCRRDAQPLFKTLVTKYSSVLDFDDTVPAMLTGPIGLKFFGIQPKSNPMMSMLQQMLA